MRALTVLAILAASSAVLLALPVRPTRSSRIQAPERPVTRPHLLLRLRPLVAMLGFLAGWGFFGGLVGVVLGLAAAVGMWHVVGR